MVTNETFDMLHDKAFRQSVYSDPRACAQKLGYELDDSVEVVVKTLPHLRRIPRAHSFVRWRSLR